MTTFEIVMPVLDTFPRVVEELTKADYPGKDYRITEEIALKNLDLLVHYKKGQGFVSDRVTGKLTLIENPGLMSSLTRYLFGTFRTDAIYASYRHAFNLLLTAPKLKINDSIKALKKSFVESLQPGKGLHEMIGDYRPWKVYTSIADDLQFIQSIFQTTLKGKDPKAVSYLVRQEISQGFIGNLRPAVERNPGQPLIRSKSLSQDGFVGLMQQSALFKKMQAQMIEDKEQQGVKEEKEAENKTWEESCPPPSPTFSSSWVKRETTEKIHPRALGKAELQSTTLHRPLVRSKSYHKVATETPVPFTQENFNADLKAMMALKLGNRRKSLIGKSDEAMLEGSVG